jgi:hypothetical protein
MPRRITKSFDPSSQGTGSRFSRRTARPLPRVRFALFPAMAPAILPGSGPDTDAYSQSSRFFCLRATRDESVDASG